MPYDMQWVMHEIQVLQQQFPGPEDPQDPVGDFIRQIDDVPNVPDTDGDGDHDLTDLANQLQETSQYWYDHGNNYLGDEYAGQANDTGLLGGILDGFEGDTNGHD